MGKYKTLARNTAIISVGTLLSKLVAFFMVRFYTGALTPSEYGTSDLLNTTVNLLMPLISFGIADGVFRFLPEYPREKKSIFSIGILTVSAGAVLLALILSFMRLFESFRGYLPLLAFMTMAACYHSVCEQYVRADGDTVLYAKQGVMNTLIMVSLNILLLTVFRLGIYGYVLSIALADTVCTVYLIAKKRLWSCLTMHPSRDILVKMLRYSIPLIPTGIFWWITSVSDRYMISAMLGEEANGIYTVANKLPTMITLLSGVLMQAWQYSAVSEAKNGLREQAVFYGNVWTALISALFFACSVMISLTKAEIRVLTGTAEYYEAWRYVPVLCAAMLFCAFTAFMGSVYTVTQTSVRSFRTSLLGAVINVVLNAILIPSPLDIQGAALATLASYFIVFAVRAENARRMIPFALSAKTLIPSTAILAVQILFICFSWRCWQLIQLLAAAALFLLGRKQIIGLISAARRNK